MFNIAPSLMCADLLQMENQVRALELAGANRFHIDVMDGHFVPNFGLNFDLVRQIKRADQRQVDLHLMVATPEQYVAQISDLHVDYVSFHIEATSAPLRIARALRAAGARTGIALNPSTPIQAVEYVLNEFDFVLVMTVEPGFAGQKFIPAMYEKVRALRKLIERMNPGMDIEVDGNLDVESSARCIRSGATILVGGTSSIFRPEMDVHSAYSCFHSKLSAALQQAN